MSLVYDAPLIYDSPYVYDTSGITPSPPSSGPGLITQAPSQVDIYAVAGNPFDLLVNFESITDAYGALTPWSNVTDMSVSVFTRSGVALTSATPTLTNEGDYQELVSWSAGQTSLMGCECTWAFSFVLNGTGPLTILAGLIEMVAE
jgi:hypothetical protein